MVMLKKWHNFSAVFFCVCLLCLWVVGCGGKSDSPDKKQTKEIVRPIPAAEPPPEVAVAMEDKEQPRPEATAVVAASEEEKQQQAPELTVQETPLPAGQPEPSPEGAVEPPPSAEKQAEIDAVTRLAAQEEIEAEELSEEKAAPVIDLDLKEASEYGEADDLAGFDQEVMDIYDQKIDKESFDPFAPLFQKEKAGVALTERPDQDGKLKSPLERIDIGQLTLAGVIMAESGSRAIVTDASGKGYVIKKGDPIGLGSGTVEKIESDRIIVIEAIIETIGLQKIEKKIERVLKLPKPAGD